MKCSLAPAPVRMRHLALRQSLGSHDSADLGNYRWCDRPLCPNPLKKALEPVVLGSSRKPHCRKLVVLVRPSGTLFIPRPNVELRSLPGAASFGLLPLDHALDDLLTWRLVCSELLARSDSRPLSSAGLGSCSSPR